LHFGTGRWAAQLVERTFGLNAGFRLLNEAAVPVCSRHAIATRRDEGPAGILAVLRGGPAYIVCAEVSRRRDFLGRMVAEAPNKR
jgi:hypothetical protein